MNYHTKGYRKPYRKIDNATQVHENYICIRYTAKGKHVAKGVLQVFRWKVGHLAVACKSIANETNYIDQPEQYLPPEKYNLQGFITVKQVRPPTKTLK